jgi:hypothetical protein
MRAFKILGSATLAVAFAFSMSACQKKEQTDMSQMNDTTQVSSGYGNEAPPSSTSPEAQPGAQGATLPTETKSTKHSGTSGTKSSTKSPGTSATYAEQHTVEIPAGTTFDIEMITPVDTRTSNAGDRVEAKLITAITRDGQVLAEAGSMVSGEVAEIQRASKSKSKEDRASIALDFTSIQTVDGSKRLHATVNNAEGKLIAKSTSTRDKLIIGGSTVAGAIVGKVAGGSTKSTIIGAVGGAAAGTGAVLMAKGHELEIPEGAKVSLRVDKPIVIVER